MYECSIEKISKLEYDLAGHKELTVYSISKSLPIWNLICKNGLCKIQSPTSLCRALNSERSRESSLHITADIRIENAVTFLHVYSDGLATHCSIPKSAFCYKTVKENQSWARTSSEVQNFFVQNLCVMFAQKVDAN